MNLQEKKDLIYNAVIDGWTVKMSDKGELIITQSRKKLKNKFDVNFDPKKYIKKLKNNK